MAEIKRTIAGLNVNSRYVVRVRALSRFNVPSDWSEALEFVTPNDTSIPNPPENLQVAFLAPEMVVEWDPPTKNTDGTDLGDLKDYTVYLTSLGTTHAYTVKDSRFTYRLSQNKQDFGIATPSILVEVTANDSYGHASETASALALNLPPKTPTASPNAIAAFTLISITMAPHPDDVADVAGYLLYHSETGAPDSYFALASTEGDSFIHEVAQGSTHYYKYKVRDFFNQVSPGFSGVTTITTLAAPALDTEPPVAVTGITATPGIDPASQRPYVDLAWDANTEEDLNRYEFRLQRTGESVVRTVIAGVADTTTRVSDLVADSEYTVVAYAHDHAGNRSTQSAAVVFQTSHDTVAPATPTGYGTVSGIRTITVHWEPNTEIDFNRYELYASLVEGFTPALSNRVFTGNASSYVKTAGDNETWYFRLRALDVNLNASAYTAEFSGNSSSAYIRDTSPPEAPTMAGVTSGLDGATAYFDVSWTQPATSDLAGFKIYYKRTDATNYSFVDVPRTNTSTRITGLIPGAAYNVRMLAYDDSLNLSNYTAEQTVSAASDTTAPPAPTPATGVVSLKNIWWYWPEVEALDFDHYEGQISTDAGFTSPTTYQLGAGGSFAWTAPAYNTTYYFRVRAVDVSGNASAWNASTSATTAKLDSTDVDSTAPGAPTLNPLATGLDVNGQVQSSYIQATWVSAGTSDISGFTLRWRKTADSLYTYMTVPAGQTTATIRGLVSNVEYGVSVSAFDTFGNTSAYTTERTITSHRDSTAPGVPANPIGTAALKSIQWSWDASTAVDLADYIAEVSSNNFTTILYTYTGSANTFTWSAPTFSTTYQMRVRARDRSGNVSANSSTATATTSADPGAVDTTPPVTPTGLALTTSGTYSEVMQDISIRATWTANVEADMSFYRVRIKDAGTFEMFQNVPFGTNAVVFPGLKPNTSYTVRVWAVDTNNNVSTGTTEATITSYKDSTPPEPVTNVVARDSLRAISFHWDHTASLERLSYYEADLSSTGNYGAGDIVYTYRGTDNMFSYQGIAGQMYYVRIRVRDIWGNWSTGYVTSQARAQAQLKDGNAPGSSPTALVRPAIGFLNVAWSPILNNDVTVYEVHVSTDANFVPTSMASATYVGETQATSFLLRNLPNQTLLQYGTTYYVRIIAKDLDGSAAPGVVGSGAILQVDALDIAQGAIDTQHIANGAIQDGNIDFGAITAQRLNVTSHLLM